MPMRNAMGSHILITQVVSKLEMGLRPASEPALGISRLRTNKPDARSERGGEI